MADILKPIREEIEKLQKRIEVLEKARSKKSMEKAPTEETPRVTVKVPWRKGR